MESFRAEHEEGVGTHNRNRGVIVLYLLLGFALGCLIIGAEDASAVERPTDPGPYSVGYIDVMLEVVDNDRLQEVDCRYYYPANSSGEGTDPDLTGAPYPTIFYHVFVQGLYVIKESKEDDRERVEELVSNGVVVLTFTPFRWDAYFGRSYYNDFVLHSDNFSANATSPLHGMIKTDSYGAAGDYWGGLLCYVHALSTPKITAVVSIGPFFPINHTPYHDPATEAWNSIDRAWMIQMGGAYAGNKGHIFTEYFLTTTDKMIVTIPGSDQRGPYRHDLIVAFFRYYLGGEEEYETFLYGEEAEKEVFTGQYRLRYQLRNDGGKGERILLQPKFTLSIPSKAMMDAPVSLEVTCEGYVLFGHNTSLHEWYVGNEELPLIISEEEQNATITFTEPGEYYVRYKYKIGNMTFKTRPATLVINNIWPMTNAGPDINISQDEQLVLDGSQSSDTSSDQDTLLYNWTFEGKQTPWSSDPTCDVDTSVIREFTATLMVMDRHGKWAMDTVTITVFNKPPEVRVGGDITSHEDEVVELSGIGNDTTSHNDTLEYKWEFGDKSSSGWSSSPDASHIYTRADTYEVRLRVKDAGGAESSTHLFIIVDNLVPMAGIDHPDDGDEMDMETKVEFVGWGMDTPSDNTSLWFTWDFDDGRTADGPEVSHSFREPGRYDVTLTVEDDDGATTVVTHTIIVNEQSGPSMDDPIVVSMAVGSIAILGLALVVSTEPGKYWLGLIFAPLFTRTQDILDNKTRHALLGIIVTNPGVHYSAIREEFGLANGQAAYHLDVLERESFIRSVRDGKLKRFYSIHSKVPRDIGTSPLETRTTIVELVRKRPWINQMEVMEELGLSRDAASYYLRDLVKEGQLKADRKGKFTVYHVRRAGR